MPSLNFPPILSRRVGGISLSYQTKNLGPHKYGCLMGLFPTDLCKEITDWTIEEIPDFYLSESGRESQIHTTFLYGFLDSLDEVREPLTQLLREFGPIDIKFADKLSLFKGNKDGDVLKIGIEGDKIHELNRLLKERFPHHEKYKNYLPHVTLAYLDPELGISGKCADYAASFLGKVVQITTAQYSDAENNREDIPLISHPNIGIKSAPENDGKWVTINGTHIHLDGKGEVDKGPKGLTGEKPKAPKVKKGKLKEKQEEQVSQSSEVGNIELDVLESEDNSVNAEQMLEDMFGKKLTEKEIGGYLGVIGDAKIKVSNFQLNNKNTVSFEVEGKGFYLNRSFVKDKDGNLTCLNNEIKITEKGTGLGTRIFTNQVKALTSARFKNIKCRATGSAFSSEYIGYKVWPKFGYDGPLSEKEKENLSFVSDDFAKANTIQELYAMPGGIKAWEENGSSIEVSFDLSPGSNSHKILDAYLNKKKEGKKYLFSYSIKSLENSESSGVEEPDISPSDEKVLDEVWEEIVKKDNVGTKGIKSVPANNPPKPPTAAKPPKSESSSSSEQGFTGEIKDSRGHTICYKDGVRTTCAGNEKETPEEKEIKKEEQELPHGTGGEKEEPKENPQDKLPDDPFDSEWDKVVSEHIDEVEKNDVENHNYTPEQVVQEKKWHQQVIDYLASGGKAQPGSVSRFITGMMNTAVGTLEYISKIIDENGDIIEKLPKEITDELKADLDKINPNGPANGLVASLVGGLFGVEGKAVTKSLSKKKGKKSPEGAAKPEAPTVESPTSEQHEQAEANKTKPSRPGSQQRRQKAKQRASSKARNFANLSPEEREAKAKRGEEKLRAKQKKRQERSDKFWEKENKKESKKREKPVPPKTGPGPLTTLGVSKNDTNDQVKKRFRDLVKVSHPDKGGDPEEYKKIYEAYDKIRKERGIKSMGNYRAKSLQEKYLGLYGKKDGFSGQKEDSLGRTICYTEGHRISCNKPEAPKIEKQTAEPKQEPKKESVSAITEKRANENYEQLKDEYLKKGQGTYDENGELKSVVLNTDDWRDLFPEYVGTNAFEVHKASSSLNKKLFAEVMQTMKGKGNNTVIILAGGAGSGKSGVNKFITASDYPIQLDQVSDEVEGLVNKIKTARENGFDVDYVFVDRPPEDAWSGGVIPRAVNARKRGSLARTVPLDVALKANIHARKTAIEILKNNLDIPVKILDNTKGFENSRLITDRKEAINHLEKQSYDQEQLYSKLKEETRSAWEKGEIDEDIAEGLIGKENLHKKGNDNGTKNLSLERKVPADYPRRIGTKGSITSRFNALGHGRGILGNRKAYEPQAKGSVQGTSGKDEIQRSTGIGSERPTTLKAKYKSMEGGTCKQGERADLTGCTPANGESKLDDRALPVPPKISKPGKYAGIEEVEGGGVWEPKKIFKVGDKRFFSKKEATEYIKKRDSEKKEKEEKETAEKQKQEDTEKRHREFKEELEKNSKIIGDAFAAKLKKRGLKKEARKFEKDPYIALLRGVPSDHQDIVREISKEVYNEHKETFAKLGFSQRDEDK